MFNEPVTGKDFFGRIEVQKLLKDRTAAFKSGFRQNLALLGRPLMGKTSILHQFLLTLNEDQILLIYAEVLPGPFYYFAQKFTGSLLYNLLRASGLQVKEDLKSLIKHSRKTAPKTTEMVRKILKLLQKGRLDEAYSFLLDLPEVVRKETQKFCVVVLDEFHQLNNMEIHQPFSVLGKKIMAQKNTLYIFSSSLETAARSILTEKLSLLFGNFEIVEVGEFEYQTCNKFLDERLDPLKIPDAYKRFIIFFTQGNPFYLDLLTQELKELAAKTRRVKVSKVLISQSLEHLLFNSRGILNQYFNTTLHRFPENKVGADLISILLSVAHNNNRMADIARFVGWPMKRVSKLTSRLTEIDMVSKTGILHRIQDKVFKFWLKSVLQRNRASLSIDRNLGAKSFRLDLDRLAAGFISDSKRDLYEKVVELFKSFRGEEVQIGHQKTRLPHFTEVGPKVIGNSGPYIIGHYKGKCWICQIMERQVTEGQIGEFVQSCSKGKYKFHKKVLIHLNGMDENARLLAKEARIWIWDLSVLNLLLELYDKYQVVRW